MRIPVSNNYIDTLHNVIGSKPTPTYPWYFNLCRARLRKSGNEFSAFSPTGKRNFHNLMKFGKLHTGIPPEVLKKIKKAVKE